MIFIARTKRDQPSVHFISTVRFSDSYQCTSTRFEDTRFYVEGKEMSDFKAAFRTIYPLLSDIYCVAVGIKLALQQTSDIAIQYRFQKGWKNDHYVSNVLVFTQNWRVIACALNKLQGSFSSLLSPNIVTCTISSKLPQRITTGVLGRVVDSAFVRARFPFL